MSDLTVAALYVEKGGAYWDLPGVDPWDEERDARLYAGPYPVVAHPPCRNWSQMGHCRPEIVRGDDGGCFAAALSAVRNFGGVLEHPARSHAWEWFGISRPAVNGFPLIVDEYGGATCEVDQRWYGHEANKPTWIYYVGPKRVHLLTWGRAPGGSKTVGRSYGGGRSHLRSRTPEPFRDLLLSMARSVYAQVPA